MLELIDALLERLDEHWAKLATAAGFMAVGWFIGRRRAKSDWQKKEFLHRLNVSLTSIQDGTLRIRTLLEKSCQDVFLNEVAAEAVVAAARSTSAEDPILPLAKDDYWYYLNAVLNEISEKFAVGQIRRDQGEPVTSARYLVCLTCECDGSMRTRKIRAMLTQRSLLDSLPEVAPKFESPQHSTRWRTLQQLAQTWRTQPHKFLEVEICA